MGSGIPYRCPCHGGPGFCQKSARPDAARALSAPERPDPGLRMELQRCQSSRARLGRPVHIPHGEGTPWHGGRAVPGEDVSETADELHLVGEPQGSHRPERLRGRVPRPRQHRGLRPQCASAHGRIPGAGRRNGVDGPLCPDHAGYCRRARRSRSSLRRDGNQILRTLCLDRIGDEHHG